MDSEPPALTTHFFPWCLGQDTAKSRAAALTAPAERQLRMNELNSILNFECLGNIKKTSQESSQGIYMSIGMYGPKDLFSLVINKPWMF